MDSLSTYTASEARKNLYSLIKKASKGLSAFEIKLRGAKPVVLISKEEIESWLETLDILANPEELKALRQAKREKSLVSHKQMLSEIGLSE